MKTPKSISSAVAPPHSWLRGSRAPRISKSSRDSRVIDAMIRRVSVNSGDDGIAPGQTNARAL